MTDGNDVHFFFALLQFSVIELDNDDDDASACQELQVSSCNFQFLTSAQN